MNYQKIYKSIIQNSKSENRLKETSVYYENHHILPKCLGGNDNEENKVLLTAKEHFICHKLLTYIYNENRKIAYAFLRMASSKKLKYNISAKDYEYAIEKIKSIPMTEEQRKNISEKTKLAMKRIEVIEKMQKPHTEEHKIKNSKSHIGKIASIETKEKMSKKRKGKNSGYKGKSSSIETRQKISIGNKNKTVSLESRLKITEGLKKYWKLKKQNL